MSGHKAVLVSGNRLFRDGIRQTLSKSGISVVGEGCEIQALLGALPDEGAADLVIIHLGAYQGAEIRPEMILELRSRLGQAKFVVLADACAKPVLPELVRADVSAILLTDISSEMLARSLDLVLSDHRLFPADIMSTLISGIGAKASPLITPPRHAGKGSARADKTEMLAADPDISPPLSKRENEVVQCLAVGLSNKTIARELNITEGTVKVHVKGLLRKIRAANRTQLAIWALRQARLKSPGVTAEVDPDARRAA